MSRSFARALIAVVALPHATFFIVYQSPDWLTQWPEQAGYLRSLPANGFGAGETVSDRRAHQARASVCRAGHVLRVHSRM